MTVKKAIDLASLKMPGNSYTYDDMCGWLVSVEKMWLDFVRRLGYETEGQIEISNTEKELLIEEPYSEIYVLWLIMKMHYYNGEIELYNNSAEAFNRYFNEAKRAYIRENRNLKNHSFTSYKEV